MFILPFLINYFLAFFATLKLKYRASQDHFSLRLISPLTLSVDCRKHVVTVRLTSFLTTGVYWNLMILIPIKAKPLEEI